MGYSLREKGIFRKGIADVIKVNKRSSLGEYAIFPRGDRGYSLRDWDIFLKGIVGTPWGNKLIPGGLSRHSGSRQATRLPFFMHLILSLTGGVGVGAGTEDRHRVIL